MRHSIATVSVSGTLEGKLQAIAQAGFAGVEIFENDLIAYPGSPREVGQMVRSLGLECVMFQPFRDFEGMPPELRQRTFDRAERKFDVMQELGTDLVLVCSNCSPQSLPDRSRIVDDFRELGERAAKRGLRIGYEGLAWGRHVNDHRDVWSIVRDVDHPNVGIILDSFHSLSRDVPVASIGDIRVEKLFAVQVADAPRLAMDYLSWSRHFRNMPGQGDFPLVDYAEALLRLGFNGWLSLEIFNDRFRAGSASGVAVDGLRSLRLLTDEAAARLRNTRPAASLPPPLPARVDVRGVEFIEFCTGEEEAPALEGMLGTLGFVPTAQHRSKAVTRWQQGGVNIVVNSETEGFAHSYNVVHGASVCAVALRVRNVPLAMERAVALGVSSHRQSVGAGEMSIPAVHGVGGALLYFIEEGTEGQVWETDFIPTGHVPEVEAGLTGVDHLAQSMQYEEFLSWLLYYVALFDVAKTPQVEIADPLGLVQSQAVQSPDRGFRVTLNGSSSQQTLSARFLHGYSGAGVQHIAFSTTDIFATAAAMSSLGLERLPIPANYYDDLEAKFGLAPELLEKLAQHHVLYDRDGEGEYFQFYSRAFARRVFFEVVQRRAYDGFGAVNATVRLAAQSRFRPDLPA
ncbi:MAG: hypothetical protein RJB26_253 [Pseudomonadota bacterium]